MNIILPNNHLSLTSQNDMDEICKPLKSLGITFFNYIKNYQDGSQITLANAAYWIRHFYDHKLYTIGTYENNPDDYYSGYGLWSTLVHETISEHARNLNIDHGITLIQKCKGNSEFYCFGTTRENDKIVNFYLNNIDLLQRFVFYFKDKAAHLINLAEKDKNRIMIPNHYENKLDIPIITRFGKSLSYFSQKLRKEFIKNTKISHYTIAIKNLGNIKITGKELECIAYLLQDKTVNAISAYLAVSPRTVEDHLNHLKTKLGCRNKTELKKRLAEYFDFLDLY
jgi:DNA-binding CsgD family transcriptional regulator